MVLKWLRSLDFVSDAEQFVVEKNCELGDGVPDVILYRDNYHGHMYRLEKLGLNQGLHLWQGAISLIANLF